MSSRPTSWASGGALRMVAISPSSTWQSLPKRAVEHWQAALAVDPDEPEAKECFAKVANPK